MNLSAASEKLSFLVLAIKLMSCWVLLIASVSVSAQIDDSATDDPDDSEVVGTDERNVVSRDAVRHRPIEEITVRAEQTVMAIRFQLREAQDDMFARFNELNNNDEFDIRCRSVRHAGSHIPRRECEPRFFTRERQSNSIQVISQMRDDGAPSGGGLGGASVAGAGNAGVATSLNFDAIENYMQEDGELRSVLGAKFEALNEEMLRIAMEDPEFLQALMRVDAFRQALVEALEQPR